MTMAFCPSLLRGETSTCSQTTPEGATTGTNICWVRPASPPSARSMAFKSTEKDWEQKQFTLLSAVPRGTEVCVSSWMALFQSSTRNSDGQSGCWPTMKMGAEASRKMCITWTRSLRRRTKSLKCSMWLRRPPRKTMEDMHTKMPASFTRSSMSCSVPRTAHCTAHCTGARIATISSPALDRKLKCAATTSATMVYKTQYASPSESKLLPSYCQPVVCSISAPIRGHVMVL
mmetsp:Transcript_25627/g.76444  ORF Transcript_25627/g.76444 Transcript_25627/m.76444 type:complete len:231 (-) Transcript_25627:432-1124(-)